MINSLHKIIKLLKAAKLVMTIRDFGAKIEGDRDTYRLVYNDDEYILLVNPNLQVFTIAKYVTAYDGKLNTRQFTEALKVVQEFHPGVTGYCDEDKDFAYIASPDFSYNDDSSMTKEEFDKIVREFDDAWIIMFGTVFAITDPSVFK